LSNTRLGHCITHARNQGTFVPSTTIATTLFNNLAGAWNTNLASFVSTSANFLNVSVRDMSALTNPSFVSTPAAAPGTSASPALPPQTAIVLSGKTGSRGKGFNARVYLPGWATNADAGGGTIAAGLQTGLNSFGSAVLAQYNAQALTFAVAHPKRQTYTGVTGTVHPERPAATVDVVTLSLKDVVFDTVRSRVKP
jgi:hypothetical protein